MIICIYIYTCIHETYIIIYLLWCCDCVCIQMCNVCAKAGNGCLHRFRLQSHDVGCGHLPFCSFHGGCYIAVKLYEYRIYRWYIYIYWHIFIYIYIPTYYVPLAYLNVNEYRLYIYLYIYMHLIHYLYIYTEIGGIKKFRHEKHMHWRHCRFKIPTTRK